MFCCKTISRRKLETNLTDNLILDLYQLFATTHTKENRSTHAIYPTMLHTIYSDVN